jgi:uncharacterized protein YciI
VKAKWTLILVATLVGCASQPPAPAPSPAAAPSAAAAPESQGPPMIYAVRFLPGPKWVQGAGPFKQPGIAEHIANMGAWEEKRVMWFGGPFMDGTGGLCGIRAASTEDAKRLADEDPCVKSGLMVAEVHPWMLACAPKE